MLRLILLGAGCWLSIPGLAVDPVLIRPLEESERRPVIIYYALDIELPLLKKAIQEDIEAIRASCESTKALDAVFFLQSDYLEKPGQFLVCRQGITQKEMLPADLNDRMNQARDLARDLAIPEDTFREKWRGLQLTFERSVFLHRGGLAYENPFAFEEWLSIMLHRARELFPQENHDHFLVLKGIGRKGYSSILHALHKEELKTLADQQLNDPNMPSLMPDTVTREKSLGLAVAGVFAALVKELRLPQEPSNEIAFLFCDFSGNPIERGNALEEFLTRSLGGYLRGFYSSEGKEIPYRSVDWPTLLNEWETSGNGSVRLYKKLAEHTGKIPAK